MRDVGRGHLGSERVIALGRLLLATLLFTAIWVDSSQPAQFPGQTHALLIAYIGVAALLVVVAWNGWWLDAQLAGPAHALDIAVFTIVVFLTQGDTSPYFIFYTFVLLAAAIRWGWRATALTAILLTLLYLIAGAATAASGTQFEIDDFITRTAYLVILSLILIWFGVYQRRARQPGPAEILLGSSPRDRSALEDCLRAAMTSAGSAAGAFVWSAKDKSTIAITIRNGDVSESQLQPFAISPLATSPYLYDLPNNWALMRDANRNLRTFAPIERICSLTSVAFGLSQGLAVPVLSESALGQLYLESIGGLSSDHLEIGDQIGSAVARQMQRLALFEAAEESAESRSRLAVARDLHDSVVQFLASAAFRLEAMKRSQASKRDLSTELNELMQLMLHEQSELRSFITALRTASPIDLADVAKDLQLLANRLARQWEIQCTFSLEPCELAVPARLHLDTQQLVREAVANAVRHAGAKNVSIRLGGQVDEVQLDFINDGSAYPRTAGGGRMPVSLRERVEAAGGALELSRGMGVTKISISLPTTGRAA